MEDYNYQKRSKGCCIIEVVISIIVAILVGVVFSRGLIVSAISFIILALIVAAISFITLIISIFMPSKYNYLEKYSWNKIGCFLTSIIGTLLTGTVALGISIVTTSLLSILSIAFTAFFFIWMILSIISLMICLIKEKCK